MPIVTLEIRGTDLPGRNCDPKPGGLPYENIHVGIARRTETVELAPGDAPSVRREFNVEVREGDDGAFDFRGPFVSGRRGERYGAAMGDRRRRRRVHRVPRCQVQALGAGS
jgi:hypothetical protein